MLLGGMWPCGLIDDQTQSFVSLRALHGQLRLAPVLGERPSETQGTGDTMKVPKRHEGGRKESRIEIPGVASSVLPVTSVVNLPVSNIPDQATASGKRR